MKKVMFHGRAASYEVVSSREIVAVVPAGASSGKVRVVTRDASVVSRVRFSVT